MDNDFSSTKVGEYIWTIRGGWVKVIGIDHNLEYRIVAGDTRYTADGRLFKTDDYPSAFITPPAEFKPKPKPCMLKKGDKVIVGLNLKRYFSHEEDGMIYCFENGRDEWSSNGVTTGWGKCRLYVKGEDN